MNKIIFLEDVKERLQTLLDDLESWVISDPDIEIIYELTIQLYEEVDSYIEE
jgi:hypothetical protein